MKRITIVLLLLAGMANAQSLDDEIDSLVAIGLEELITEDSIYYATHTRKEIRHERNMRRYREVISIHGYWHYPCRLSYYHIRWR